MALESRGWVVLGVALALVLGLALAVWAEEGQVGQPAGPGYGMMGPGGGGQGMGPGMMGPGVGGYGMGPAYDPQGLKPEQRQALQRKWNQYQMDSLALRQQIVVKRMEMETLWNQPQVDQARLRALSAELAGLDAQLAQKRDQFLLDCRQEFGDQGWQCPGWRWGGGYGGAYETGQ